MVAFGIRKGYELAIRSSNGNSGGFSRAPNSDAGKAEIDTTASPMPQQRDAQATALTEAANKGPYAALLADLTTVNTETTTAPTSAEDKSPQETSLGSSRHSLHGVATAAATEAAPLLPSNDDTSPPHLSIQP